MKPDFLTKKAISRATDDSLSYQYKRGRVSALLFINTMSWHLKDKITVKLRTPEGLITVVDRVSAFLLLTLCDFKQGKPTTGNANYNDDAVPNGVEITSHQNYVDNAFILPLGHLTLDACEMEIIVETAAQAAVLPATTPQTGTVKIIAIENAPAADFLMTYSVNNDLENTAHQVREMYLVQKDLASFFVLDGPTNGVIANDIICRLDVDGSTNEVDIEVLGAITAITGELTQAPNFLVQAFKETGSIGATVTVKVFGADADTASILYIQERTVPSMANNSVHSAIAIEQRKVEKLELREPEQAAALRALGKISSSSVLAEAKANLPAQVVVG